MGLDEFRSQSSYDVGNVSSRKSIENISFSRNSWQHLIYHTPGMAQIVCRDLAENEIKALVELMDELIEGDVDVGFVLNDENIDMIRNERDEIVNYHLK